MTTYDEILGQLRSKLDEVVGLARDLVGEPSRAEVEREIAEALRHNAEGFRGTKGDATVGEWCRLWADDIEEGDYRKPRGTWWPLSSGAAENQPQPACPPDPVNSDDRDVADVAAALADARLAKGLSAPYYHSAIAALQRLASRCLVRRDPAPEAPRAQSLVGRIDEISRRESMRERELPRYDYSADEIRAAGAILGTIAPEIMAGGHERMRAARRAALLSSDPNPRVRFTADGDELGTLQLHRCHAVGDVIIAGSGEHEEGQATACWLERGHVGPHVSHAVLLIEEALRVTSENANNPDAEHIVVPVSRTSRPPDGGA
jgi:hypothetical protein